MAPDSCESAYRLFEVRFTCAGRALERPHPKLLIPGQSPAGHHRATLLFLARAAHRSQARGPSQTLRSLALPLLWWADARHPTLHGYRYSTPLPSSPGGRMRRLSTSRLLWVPRHSPSFCVVSHEKIFLLIPHRHTRSANLPLPSHFPSPNLPFCSPLQIPHAFIPILPIIHSP